MSRLRVGYKESLQPLSEEREHFEEAETNWDDRGVADLDTFAWVRRFDIDQRRSGECALLEDSG